MPTIHERLVAVAARISPPLRQAMAETGPLRLKRPSPDESLAERLCRAVAGQQLSVAAARTIWLRLLAQTEGRTLVEHLHRASTAGLRSAGLSMAKAKTMKAIATADANGDLDVERLAAFDPADRAAHLTAIWGVGTWTADMIGIFYFGDRDIWPDGDVTARKTLIRLTSSRRKTMRTAAHFAPYRSYLALHMWRAARAIPQ